MKIHKLLTNMLCLLCIVFSFAQSNQSTLKNKSIYGVVIDEKTKEPIAGASVYFDNTTVGTITNFEGEFTFDYDNKINASLVISFIGYKTIVIPSPKYNEKYTVLLAEDVSSLDEVYIEYKDEWSRAYKLKQFRKEFLGSSKFSRACKILNEDDIILRFNSKEKQLTAQAKQPIIIKNEALDYEIKYDLSEFVVDYGSGIGIRESVEDNKDKWYYFRSVYYAGTTFFKTIPSKNHKKALKNREKAYKGSVPHFMRSIANNSLKKDKYRIFKGSKQVPPELFIHTETIDSLNLTKVRIPHRLNILYKTKHQSAIESKVDSFTIDAFGNHNNISEVLFGGVMGDQRLGETLPYDYGLE